MIVYQIICRAPDWPVLETVTFETREDAEYAIEALNKLNKLDIPWYRVTNKDMEDFGIGMLDRFMMPYSNQLDIIEVNVIKFERY